MEIKSTIFSMKPLKAPIDNLYALFYQSKWSVVSESFCSFINNIFSSGHIPHEISRTLIAIIPKNENLISLKMYRPISLCMVACKKDSNKNDY